MRSRSKYHSKKVNVNGIDFDSKKEAARYRELVLLERAGRIQNLQTQVKFVLIPAQYERYERISPKTGKRLQDGVRAIEKEISYIADFVYTENGKRVVEDVKGYKKGTAYSVFTIKRKMMLYFHNIRIKET